jgi:3-dehydroquinate synthase
VGNGTINLLGRYIRRLNIGRDAYIITNALIKDRYAKLLNKTLGRAGFNVRYKLIPDSEKSKSIEMASSIIKDIARYDKKKQIFVIAFGGGVIGDLAGFVASIYKRGIPYIQIPTTLLAQVDSSIGGKTAVDLTEGKNLVGAFYQPRLVFIDIKVLKTLGLRQVRAGLAEIIKYGIIKDRKLFLYLERNYKNILALKPKNLEFIVSRCVDIKSKVIQRDEREEKGLRTILNFGHTIGHALEIAGDFKKYNHGEAVALGMLVAADMSKKLKLITNEISQRIEKLIAAMGLPIKIEKIPIGDIIKAHYRDKKFIGPKNRFVLIKNIGQTLILENIPLEIIRESLARRISSLTG